MNVAKYMGPTFTLLMTLGSAVVDVLFIAKGEAIGIATMTAMAAISGYVVVKVDWPRVWKPLLGL